MVVDGDTVDANLWSEDGETNIDADILSQLSGNYCHCSPQMVADILCSDLASSWEGCIFSIPVGPCVMSHIPEFPGLKRLNVDWKQQQSKDPFVNIVIKAKKVDDIMLLGADGQSFRHQWRHLVLSDGTVERLPTATSV